MKLYVQENNLKRVEERYYVINMDKAYDISFDINS